MDWSTAFGKAASVLLGLWQWASENPDTAFNYALLLLGFLGVQKRFDSWVTEKALDQFIHNAYLHAEWAQRTGLVSRGQKGVTALQKLDEQLQARYGRGATVAEKTLATSALTALHESDTAKVQGPGLSGE